MKRILLPACLSVLLSGAAQRDELVLGFEEGDSITRTFEAIAEYGIDSIAITFDDQDGQTTEDIDFSLESLERIVVRDEVIEVENGRPIDFRRTFVELLQEATVQQNDEEFESTSISDFEGLTVRFLWDDVDEEFYAELDDEDDRMDEDLISALAADMDFSVLLPDGEVDEGDEWEFDGRAYLVLMWPGGLVAFYDEESQVEVDPFDHDMNLQVVENLEGEGTAVLEEIRDEDGIRVAVIRVEIDIETSAEGEDADGITHEIEFEREIEGELLWDLEHGQLLSATFEADSEWTRTRTGTIESDDAGEHEFSKVTTYSGTIEYEVEFERE